MFYLIFGAVIALVSGFLIPAVSLLYRVINGLFVGGIIVLFYGLLSYVAKVGFFDLFVYSHKKLFRHSKHNEDSKDGDEPKKLGSFHEYLLEKEEKQTRTKPIVVGGLLVAASILLVVAEPLL